MSEESGEVVLIQAANEAERKAYFQPFEDAGKKLCGAARQRCSRCRHQFRQGERFSLVCPDCGHDRRCRSRPKPNGRCKRHGGERGRGEFAHNYKHGRHVKKLPHFPKEVQAAFADAYQSADMESIIEEYALVRAKLRLVAQNIKDATNWRDELLTLADAIENDRPAAQSGDKAAASRVAASVDELLARVRDGAAQSDWWDDALALNDRSAQLKLAHSQIERNHSAVLSAQKAIEFVTLISRGVKEALLLVREKCQLVRQSLADESGIQTIVDDAVAAIDGGGDAREAVSAAIARLAESVPLDAVDGSFSAANQIVQGRIRSMIE